MLQFLHLSNLHTEARGKRNNQIELRLDYIRERYPACKLLITGDLVDDGSEKQYETLKRMLVGFECYCCSGNHDYGLAGNFYRRHSAKLYDKYFGKGHFAGKNKPVVDYLNNNGTKVMLIALDSNLETRHPFDFARGKIGVFQRRHLKKLLTSNSNIVKIVYFHHHLLWMNHLLCLADAQKLMPILYEQVDIVLFGHKHKAGIWTDSHKPYYVLAADRFPESNTAQRITIDSTEIEVDDVKIV